MAKHFGAGGEKPRHLRAAAPGETPAEPFAPSEAQTKYLERITGMMDAGKCDQFVTICCRGGYIVDFVSLDENRHHVTGVLGDAAQLYEAYTSPIMCDCDD